MPRSAYVAPVTVPLTIEDRLRYREAALFSVWALCKQRECDAATHADMVRWADERPARDAEWADSGFRRENTLLGTETRLGNPSK